VLATSARVNRKVTRREEVTPHRVDQSRKSTIAHIGRDDSDLDELEPDASTVSRGVPSFDNVTPSPSCYLSKSTFVGKRVSKRNMSLVRGSSICDGR
jgi:hypothetical protein